MKDKILKWLGHPEAGILKALKEENTYLNNKIASASIKGASKHKLDLLKIATDCDLHLEKLRVDHRDKDKQLEELLKFKAETKEILTNIRDQSDADLYFSSAKLMDALKKNNSRVAIHEHKKSVDKFQAQSVLAQRQLSALSSQGLYRGNPFGGVGDPVSIGRIAGTIGGSFAGL